jgi:hypothetical protein
MPRRKLFQTILCLVSLLFLFGCSQLTGHQANKPEPPKEFAGMVAKKDELALLPTAEKLGKTPVIKGKIAIVTNSDGTPYLDRFSQEGEAFFSDAPIPVETSQNFLPADLYAKSPEEIETLIKIDCVTKKDQALYTKSGSLNDEMMVYEYVICEIKFVDYKSATVVAKKEVGKNVPPKVINDRTISRHPWREICEYLRSAKSSGS